MTRLFPAAAAGLICGVYGLRRASALRRESSALLRWEQLLRYLTLLVQEGTASLPDVFDQCASEDTEPDALMHALADDMRAHPLEPLPQLFAARARPEARETPLLLRMMGRISRGSLENRAQAAAQAAEEMALMSKCTAEKAARDAKMWSQLGWAVGACLTLLLL